MRPNPRRVAATVYGINLLLAMVLVSVLWRYAVHAAPACGQTWPTRT